MERGYGKRNGIRYTEKGESDRVEKERKHNKKQEREREKGKKRRGKGKWGKKGAKERKRHLGPLALVLQHLLQNIKLASIIFENE